MNKKKEVCDTCNKNLESEEVINSIDGGIYCEDCFNNLNEEEGVPWA